MKEETEQETNYQVAVEKTLIRVDEGDERDCYEYNDEVLEPKFNKIRMDLVKYLLDLKYSEWIEHLTDYTDRGDDDFENYDEYTCDYIRDLVVDDFITKRIEETEYTQEVMDEWDNEKYPD